MTASTGSSGGSGGSGGNPTCTTQPVTIAHTGGTTNPNQPRLIFVDTTKYPQAICNDGSPAAYVFRPGVGAAATRWIISLEGGHDCYDNASCSARAANQPHLISTAGFATNPSSAPSLTGMLSSNPSENPDFYDASVVRIAYCSSDDWSGAKSGSGAFNPNDDTTWNFQGHAIVKAVIDDLIANHGLGQASEIMLTGESAGGLGVYVNANTVAGIIPQSARYLVYDDAAFDNLVYNFSPSAGPPNYDDPGQPTNQQTEKGEGIALWNGTGDSACAASATTPTQQLDCYSAQQLLAPGGTLTFPLLVSEAEQDTAQLSTAGIPLSDLSSGNLTPAEQGYVDYFTASMRTGLATANANVSIFSPNILAHVESIDQSLFVTPQSFPSSELTLQSAVGQWYQNPCSAKKYIAQ
ncbi:MAG: pectin acetylesterase-family hydrolase [Acidobacteriaceae bacterium]